MAYDPNEPRDKSGKWTAENAQTAREAGHAIRHVRSVVEVTQNSPFVRQPDKKIADIVERRIELAANAATVGRFSHAMEHLKQAGVLTKRIEATGHGDNMMKGLKTAARALKAARGEIASSSFPGNVKIIDVRHELHSRR